MIEFVVWGKCFGKGRPRFRKVGKFVQTYTDKETVNYETLVKLSFINSGCEPYLNDEPLECRLIIYQEIPTSTSNKRKRMMADGKILPTKKPDVDNVVKSIFDGLNKVAFKDDTQIVELHCSKRYSYTPRVEVTFKEFKVEND